jgi:hypothetical protein
MRSKIFSWFNGDPFVERNLNDFLKGVVIEHVAQSSSTVEGDEQSRVLTTLTIFYRGNSDGSTSGADRTATPSRGHRVDDQSS